MQYSYPTRVIAGNDIIELQIDNGQVVIGHTLSYCENLEKDLNEAISKAEMYYNRLVELGDIVKPKSTEELLAEQQEVNIKLINAISLLTEKVEQMEKVGVINGLSEYGIVNSSSTQPTTSGKSKKGT